MNFKVSKELALVLTFICAAIWACYGVLSSPKVLLVIGIIASIGTALAWTLVPRDSRDA
ncbi:hypothetical protein [Buchananella hordeovulneris]|uniref:hypothetical protein n=1 Tax=Buchananella hordeovulneris TaxID=52770 RepID=UPI00163AE125|nr:hypothetical protein [Buchananella hordeovulneris]